MMFESLLLGRNYLSEEQDKFNRHLAALVTTLTHILVEKGVATEEEIDLLRVRYLAEVDQVVATKRATKPTE